MVGKMLLTFQLFKKPAGRNDGIHSQSSIALQLIY